jgi:tetratricopeptide (TPR) repeat protein
MSASRQRAKDIFIAALDQPAGMRAAFVSHACGTDADVRREVESLLAFHDAENEEQTGGGEERTADFVPGHLFAGRYRMVERLGRGGMGEVWRADDLVLETAVALKLIQAESADARARILNEVRLARQVTHPAVCRVYDVGEAEGLMFFSMELIRGEDLASVLRRVGRLPQDKVIEIGLQLCAGLAAAHAQGVLHRDLKPANILIDDNGLVRISDFGIAIQRTHVDRHALTGTPAFMAPEQRTPGTPVSERTDVYALGLVLYDLLVGGHSIPKLGDIGLPPVPSSRVPGIDKRLEAIVMASLAYAPDNRPASVLDVWSVLTAVSERRHGSSATGAALFATRPRVWLVASAIAAAVIAVVVLSSFVVAPGAPPLTERDTIVLADFENSTGEPVFNGTLKVALAVALEQSPFLKVFPDERARETLRLMERSPDERVTRTVAREIAQREQLKALVAGSIAPLGQHYVIALEAINAQTGDVMAREQAEASSKEQVLTSLGASISRLRQKLGESLASVQKFDVSLPRATTTSLEALHAYSLALYEGREVPRLEAVPHLTRAIELDENFAMAHAQLSAVYANTQQSTLAPAHSRKAFELRDRVSDRERFFISWRYYRDAAQAWDKALELARTWATTYPREAFAFNALGNALIRLGQFEQSVPPLREAIRLDPRFIPAYSNLAGSLLALNEIDEAKNVLQEAEDRQLNFIGARRLRYLLAFMEGDAATMERELQASIGVHQNNAAYGWQAHTLASAGRMKAAHDQYRRGIDVSLQGGFNEVAAQLSTEDAEMHAAVGQCSDALTEVAGARTLGRDNLTLERSARALALCGRHDEAATVSDELARAFPDATLTVQVSIPVIEAGSALSRRDAQSAVDILNKVRPYDHAPSAEFWPSYLRGQAYLQLKNGAAAAEQFEYIMRHQGEVPGSVLFPLAHLGHARAAALSGDTPRARDSYKRFFEIWTQPDSDLRPLADARAELAQLGELKDR